PEPELAAEGAAGEGTPPEAPQLVIPEGAFPADLAEWAGAKFKASTQAETEAILERLNGARYVVSRIEQKDRIDKAPPPFTTSTLQQQAAIRLGFHAQRTMRIAQHLYEGVDLGAEGQVALITYMRTDSTRVSADALNAVRTLIAGEFGDDYLPEK